MSDVQKVPNNVKNWLEAAKYLYKQECKEDAPAKEAKEYSQKLQKKNPGRPTPASADIRWWPWVRHKIFDSDIVFKGPDPVCPQPEPAFEPLDIGPKPEEKPEPKPEEKPEPKPDKKPVKPPIKKNGTKKPAKVSDTTKKQITTKANRAATLIKKMNALKLKKEAAALKQAAEAARDAAKGDSEKEAKEALTALNAELENGKQKYNKIAKDYGLEEFK